MSEIRPPGLRTVLRILLLAFIFLILPAVIGAAATAWASTSGATPSQGALSWLDLTDSAGVPLSSYRFAGGGAGLLYPEEAALSVVIDLEVSGYLVLVCTALWLIGYVLDFQWLNWIGAPLRGAAEGLTEQLATPAVLGFAVTLGAFFVAWFVARGRFAKAATQVCTMLIVAFAGPLLLADPLGEVLAPDGVLAQGRDVGMSVAAGLSGDADADPRRLTAVTQQNLADGFARYPLQVWNFGHVVDERPGCETAWSAGIRSGDPDQVRAGLLRCGDQAAYDASAHPDLEQVGAGLLLLVAALILLAFGSYLSVKVVWAALDAVYHGLMFLFGLAAGGFVYGPTQTFMIRNGVDGGITFLRMICYIEFLAVYQLFVGELLSQARGRVMPVLVLAAIVQIIAILQLRRLSAALDRGNDWVANRIALAVQGNPGGGGDSDGGRALGMGVAGAGNSLPQWGILASLAAVSTINNSPVIEWLSGMRRPMSPFARLERAGQINQWQAWADIGPEWTNQYYNQRQLMVAAQTAIADPLLFAIPDTVLAGRLDRETASGLGGVDTARGAASVVHAAIQHAGGDVGKAWAALEAAGFTDTAVMRDAVAARSFVERYAEDEPRVHKQLAQAMAALRGFEGERTPARLAELEMSVLRYRGAYDDVGPLALEHQRIADAYLNDPTAGRLESIRQVTEGAATEVDGVPLDSRDAKTIMSAIGVQQAGQVIGALDRLLALDPDLLSSAVGDGRLAALREGLVNSTESDLWASGVRRSPVNSPPPRSRP